MNFIAINHNLFKDTGQEPYYFENKEVQTKYIDNIIMKIQRSAGAKKILKLDISNCYDSIYTHFFPAIILGIDRALKQYRNKDARTEIYEKYSKLDSLVRYQNKNQTKGILCGIITSRILSEALLVQIDQKLVEKGIKFVRYVDDYEVFIYNDEEKIIISQFNEILSKYKLQLNYEKIEIKDFPYFLEQNFEEILNKFNKFDSKIIFNICTMFYQFENKGIKGAIKFLLKYLDKVEIDELDSKKLYCAYLITTMTNDERALFKACDNLIDYKEILEKEQINILKKLLKRHIRYGNDLEVIWLVYTIIMLGNCSAEVISEVINSKNELAIALLVEKGLVVESDIKNLNITTWLLAYQLFSRDNMDENRFKEIVGDSFSFYKFLKEKKFSFIKFICNKNKIVVSYKKLLSS